MNFYPKIFLICLFKSMMSMQPEKCKRNLIESYGIMSYSEPAKENLVLCPNIKASCCPAYEQFKMYLKYHNEIKPQYVALNELIPLQLRLLDKRISAAMQNTNLAGLIENIEDTNKRQEAEDIYNNIKNKSITAIVQKLLKHHPRASSFTSNLKSTFFCYLCDYASHHSIDIKKKYFVFNDESCDNLVRETFWYSNALNSELMPFLENLSEIFSKINPKDKSMVMPNLDGVRNSIKECYEEFKDNDEELSACRKYCSFFKINMDLPVFEGYPEFFFNFLFELHQAIPMQILDQEDENESEDENARILSLLNKEEFESLRNIGVLRPAHKNNYKNKTKRYKKMISILDNFSRKKRLLEAEPVEDEDEESKKFLYDLDPKFILDKNLHLDPYVESSHKLNMSDDALSEMFSLKGSVGSEDASELKKIILKHYAENCRVEIEDIDDDNIFNTEKKEIVQVHKFFVHFSYNGINFYEIIKMMDWEIGFQEIALSLAGENPQNGQEAINTEVLLTLNEINNSEVEDLHRDTFMKFNSHKKIGINAYLNKEIKLLSYQRLMKSKKFEIALRVMNEADQVQCMEVVKQKRIDFVTDLKLTNKDYYYLKRDILDTKPVQFSEVEMLFEKYKSLLNSKQLLTAKEQFMDQIANFGLNSIKKIIQSLEKVVEKGTDDADTGD